MTNKKILEMLRAELTCVTKSISGTRCHFECHNCKNFYLIGTYGERQEMLKTLIKKLEMESD